LAVYVGTSGRNLYGMSRVGYIPRLLSQIHRRFQTPWVALLVATVIGIAFMAPFPTWYAIMSYSTVMTIYGYLQVGISNHVLRRVAPDLNRPFKTPAWYIFYPVSFIVASLLIYWSSWTYVNAIVAGVVLGFPLLLLGPYRSEIGFTRGTAVTFAVIYWIASAALITGWYLGWFSGLGSITILRNLLDTNHINPGTKPSLYMVQIETPRRQGSPLDTHIQRLPRHNLIHRITRPTINTNNPIPMGLHNIRNTKPNHILHSSTTRLRNKRPKRNKTKRTTHRVTTISV